MNFSIQIWKYLVIGLLILTGMGLQAQTGKSSSAQAETRQAGSASAKVNINTAGPDELATLPRIGPVIAKRIIEFREEHQGFKKVEELMNVKGIGPKTFEKLAPLITL